MTSANQIKVDPCEDHKCSPAGPTEGLQLLPPQEVPHAKTPGGVDVSPALKTQGVCVKESGGRFGSVCNPYRDWDRSKLRGSDSSAAFEQ